MASRLGRRARGTWGREKPRLSTLILLRTSVYARDLNALL